MASNSSHIINVLDRGYVMLVDHMGNDLTPVNAARASFHKRSEAMTPADERLLDYLVVNKHLSVFRHQVVTLEWYAPLFVARQIWRYTVGNAQQDTIAAWNEASYRYISNSLEYYVPTAKQWRGKPESVKQGSAGNVDLPVGRHAESALLASIHEAMQDYEWAIGAGIAPEQARLFLPANCQYTYWWMTASLQSIVHLLEERGDPHAMHETRLYARAVYDLVKPLFTRSINALLSKDVLARLEA